MSGFSVTVTTIAVVSYCYVIIIIIIIIIINSLFKISNGHLANLPIHKRH